jgi:hypothetical protein
LYRLKTRFVKLEFSTIDIKNEVYRALKMTFIEV